MTSRSRFAFGAAALLASTAFAPAVFAQTTDDRHVTITERPRPEVDPLGVRMGSFLLFPKFGLAGYYNDNIFASNTNEVDDYITVFSPSVDMRSNWNNHALNFGGRADIGRYADNGAEDYEDYNAYVNGRVDVTRNANFGGGLSYSKLHEDRGSPDDVNGVNPTEYSLLAGNAGFSQRFNRVSVGLTADLRRYDYDNVRTSTGTTINNNDRDRDEYEFGVRLGYEIVPAYEAFVRLSYNERKYDAAVDDNGFRRDSDGYEAVAGVRLDLSGKTFGDVFVGYRTQDYEDPSLPSISGMSYGAAITWNATSLTTAKFSLSRTVEESTLNGASGYFATRAGATVDHELLRNLLVGGGIGYTVNDYEGINRQDDLTDLNLYAKYLWNRYLNFSVGFNHRNRDSDAAGADYDQNSVMLKVEATL